MRLATYRRDGLPAGAVVVERDGCDRVVDLVGVSDGAVATVTDALSLDQDARAELGRAAARQEGLVLSDVDLLAPVPRPSKLVAVAGNYQEHLIEGGAARVDKARAVPLLFLKPPSAILGPEQPLRLPHLSTEVDWEVELAAVIGREAKDVRPEDVEAHLGGYTILNDVSARSIDWGVNRDDDAAGWHEFHDWLAGKWFDGFAPMGPYIVTADQLREPSSLALELLVNGEIMQSGFVRDMIFDVAEIVSFASRVMTLEPGDVVATGTPAGVGATTSTFLEAGDVMEARIAGLGSLRTPVVGAA